MNVFRLVFLVAIACFKVVVTIVKISEAVVFLVEFYYYVSNTILNDIDAHTYIRHTILKLIHTHMCIENHHTLTFHVTLH